MAVEIHELEVVPPAPGSDGKPITLAEQPSRAPDPELELQIERAARLRQSRDLRLHAD
jgi:hypothetical protein